jgi:DNA primase
MEKKRMDLRTLDVVAMLNAIPVEVVHSGKNVTAGWVNTNCPYCFDPSAHLGINLESKGFSCWICRKSGSVFTLVKRLMKTNNKDTFAFLKKFLTGKVKFYDEPESSSNKQDVVTLPSHILKSPLPVHTKYLRGRGFKPKELEDFFGIRYTGQISKYKASTEKLVDFKYRIIIPIYINGKLVNFTARDVTGMAEEKYKNCPTDDTIITTKDAIYGYDSIVDDTAVLVEGPTDVWRIGPGALGFFGIKYTRHQLNLLYQKGLKKAVVFFDNEPMAQKIAETLAKEIGSFIPDVSILVPDDSISDPGEMTRKQVKELWRMVYGNS